MHFLVPVNPHAKFSAVSGCHSQLAAQSHNSDLLNVVWDRTSPLIPLKAIADFLHSRIDMIQIFDTTTLP